MGLRIYNLVGPECISLLLGSYSLIFWEETLLRGNIAILLISILTSLLQLLKLRIGS
jgi:hypothetical protein